MYLALSLCSLKHKRTHTRIRAHEAGCGAHRSKIDYYQCIREAHILHEPRGGMWRRWLCSQETADGFAGFTSDTHKQCVMRVHSTHTHAQVSINELGLSILIVNAYNLSSKSRLGILTQAIELCRVHTIALRSNGVY